MKYLHIIAVLLLTSVTMRTPGFSFDGAIVEELPEAGVEFRFSDETYRLIPVDPVYQQLVGGEEMLLMRRDESGWKKVMANTDEGFDELIDQMQSAINLALIGMTV